MLDIYQILEQFHEIRDSLRRQDETLKELVKQGAVNTHIINEHHKRSNMLEEALKPIQDDFKFRSKFTKLVFGTAGAISLIGIIIGIVATLIKLI